MARPAGSNLPNPDPVVARSVAMGALFGSAVLARAGASFRGDAARSRINGALPGSAVFARPAGSAIAAAETVSNAAVRGIGGFMTSSFLLRGQQSVPMDVPCQHVSNAGLSRRNSYRIYSPSPARSRASTGDADWRSGVRRPARPASSAGLPGGLGSPSAPLRGLPLAGLDEGRTNGGESLRDQGERNAPRPTPEERSRSPKSPR